MEVDARQSAPNRPDGAEIPFDGRPNLSRGGKSEGFGVGGAGAAARGFERRGRGEEGEGRLDGRKGVRCRRRKRHAQLSVQAGALGVLLLSVLFATAGGQDPDCASQCSPTASCLVLSFMGRNVTDDQNITTFQPSYGMCSGNLTNFNLVTVGNDTVLLDDSWPEADDNTTNTAIVWMNSSSTCRCPAGQIGDGCTCQMDCSIYTEICDSVPGTMCMNRPGNANYTCECLPGTTFDNGACVPCSNYTFKAHVGNDACSLCSDGFSPGSRGASENGSSSCICAPGYYMDSGGGRCLPCARGTYKAEFGNETCSQCLMGSFQDKVGQSSCKTCPANTFNPRNGSVWRECFSCKACPPGQISPPGSTRRSMCTCDVGFTGQSGLVCRPCAAGEFKNFTGDGQCQSCSQFGDPFLYSDPGSEMCGCDKGYEGDPPIPTPRDGVCTECPRGSYKGFVGGFQGNCSLCPANTFSNVSAVATCEPCRNFSESAAGSLSQEDCVCFPGYTVELAHPNASEAESPCVACPAGEYKSLPGPSPCLECLVGSYSSAAGSATCQDCPAFTTTNGNRSASFSECRCQPGYSGNNAYNCSACPVNFYQPNVSFGECTPCPSHSTTQGESASTTCVCNDGFTIDYDSPTLACKPCSGQVPCQIGEFWRECLNELDAACDTCPTGATNPNHEIANIVVGIESCICDAGYHSQEFAGGECQVCPANTYKSLIGDSQCIACEEGLVSYNGSTSPFACGCVPGNTFNCECEEPPCDCTQVLVDPALCAPCEPGTFKETIAPVPCEPCAVGTYQNEEAQSSCFLCPPNSNTSGRNASSDITDCVCDAGYEGAPGGPCLPCEAGTFKNNSGTYSCASCTEGVTYQDEVGQLSCKPCLATARCPDGLYWRTCPVDEDGRCAQCTNPKPQDSRYVDHGRPLNVNFCAWECEAGHLYDRELDICEACPTGTFLNKADGSDGDVCEPCPYPSTTGGPGSEFCTLCSAGFYIVTYGPNGHAVCERCSSPFTTTPGGVQTEFSSDACRCKPGYQGFSWACTACRPGSYKESITVSNDATMFFQQVSLDSDICLPCPEGFFGTRTAQTSLEDCTACPPNSISDPGSRTCKCIPGFFDNETHPTDTSCIACPQHTFSNATGAVGAASCQACPGGGFTDGEASSSINDCRCGAGTFGDVPSGIPCVDCPAGTYQPLAGQQACIDCTPFSTSPNGSYFDSQCTCFAGYYGITADGGECTPCPFQSSSPAGSELLADCSCNAGYSGEPGNGTDCTLCFNNSFSWVSPLYCSCNAGYYGGTIVGIDGALNETGVCSVCPEGSNSTTATTSIAGCTCLVGFYGGYSEASGNVECAACPLNSNSPVSSTDVSQCVCNEGYFGTFSMSVAVNGTGGGIVIGECVLCRALDPNADDYGSQVTQEGCSCDPGYYGNPHENASASSQCSSGAGNCSAVYAGCSPCPANTYLPTDSALVPSECIACPALSTTDYAASTAVSQCLCNVGTYRTVAHGGFVSCTLCPVATYNPTRGALSVTSCLSCPSFSKGLEGASDISACKCNPGFYASATNSSNSSSSASSFQCLSCPFGTFSLAAGGIGVSSCLACPLHSTSLPSPSINRTVCKCGPGYYGDATLYPAPTDPLPDSGCNACPADTYGGAGTSNASCLDCGASGYSAAGSEFCLCASGFWGDPSIGVECTACQANATSLPNTTTQDGCHCSPGLYSNNGACVPCPPGTSSDVGAQSASECYCSVGFYGPGGTNCVACPTNRTTLNVSSVNASQCVCADGFYSEYPVLYIDQLSEENVSYACGNGTNTSCPVGAVVDEAGAGSYNVTENVTRTVSMLSSAFVCLPCPANTFNILPGQNTSLSCRPCPALTLTPPGTGAEGCGCNAGLYKSSTSGACEPCPAGTSRPEYRGEGLLSCIACPPGTSSVDGSTSCDACGTGTYRETLTLYTNETACNEARSLLANATCSSVETNATTLTGGNETNATSVNGSTVDGSTVNASSSNGSTCASADVDVSSACSTYQVPGGCVACPSNTISGVVATSIDACVCVGGYFGTGRTGACSPCPNGTHIPWDAANAVTTIASCIACPVVANYTTPQGSDRC